MYSGVLLAAWDSQQQRTSASQRAEQLLHRRLPPRRTGVSAYTAGTQQQNSTPGTQVGTHIKGDGCALQEDILRAELPASCTPAGAPSANSMQPASPTSSSLGCSSADGELGAHAASDPKLLMTPLCCMTAPLGPARAARGEDYVAHAVGLGARARGLCGQLRDFLPLAVNLVRQFTVSPRADDICCTAHA